MMSESWYTVVDAGQPLTQGDLIRDCPIRGWRDDSVDFDRGLESLDAASEAKLQDVVIMTQACDLAHDKVPNVVLCPHWSLSTYHEDWDAEMRVSSDNYSSASATTILPFPPFPQPHPEKTVVVGFLSFFLVLFLSL